MHRTPLASLVLLLSGAAHAEIYTDEPGFDRPGEAYETFEQTSDFQSPTLCKDACYSQPRCRSFTWVKPGVDGPNAFCRLKDHVPPPVENACCTSAVKGGNPAQPAVPSMKLTWLGQEHDKVGKAPRPSAPDGATDHHLRLDVSPAMAPRVVAIELREIVKDGLRWSSRDDAAEHLAVEAGGERLNPDGTKTLAPRNGATFDLYAHDIGQWDVHRSVVATIELDDGRRIEHTYRIEAPPDRLLGLWQMHCQPGSPDAFEPLTLSGRVWLTVAEGKVTGMFSSTPFEGTVDANGRFTAKGATKATELGISGELGKIVPGKPIKGSGAFELTRSDGEACVGTGVWGPR